MNRALRSSVTALAIAGSLAITGVAAAITAAAPEPTTRVFMPAMLAPTDIPACDDLWFEYEAPADPPNTFPEEEAVSGPGLDRSNLQPKVFKPP